jgi:hypothetical protein
MEHVVGIRFLLLLPLLFMPLFVSGFVMFRSAVVLLEALCSAIYEVKSDLNLADLKVYPSWEHLDLQWFFIAPSMKLKLK